MPKQIPVTLSFVIQIVLKKPNYNRSESKSQRDLLTQWLIVVLSQLRHIENRLEAAPGTGVLLDSVLDTKKASVSGGRKISRRDGHHVEESGSKSRTRSRRSPDKSSRSPLRNSTLDSNARKPSAVEFREPLVSYREASPLPVSQTHPEPEAHSLPTELGVPQPNFALSQLVYHRDTRDMQTADLDSSTSSAVDSTSVRYLNDLSALNAVDKPDQAQQGSEVNPRTHLQAQTSQISMSVTASLRLENLRRRQPDEKLEKLKDTIRRQREHLEGTEERNRLLEYLEEPVGIGAASHSTTVPTAKVRKVAPAPPAPIYKGFNTCETKIRSTDGKVWAEEDFQILRREIYRDLTKQLTAKSTKPKQRPAERDRVKEKKPSKPVRKVHRSSSAPDSNTKPGLTISTSSWRDGQKLVKMMLGPPPRLHREPRAKSSETQIRTGERMRYCICQALPPSHANSLELSQTTEKNLNIYVHLALNVTRYLVFDLLSADIRGILDDLQLEADSSRRPEAPRSKVHASTRVSRSSSPAKTTKRADPPEHPVAKKRHYDAEAVRLYIIQKQEERKKQQAEERRAQREEEENKNKRLQELYRRQRAGATKVPVAPEGPIKKRLQETYTKLLLEQTHVFVVTLQPRPVYQPSGESDKENKRHDRPQSATSSSDLSLTEQWKLLAGKVLNPPKRSPWLQSDQCSPALRVSSSLVPPSGHIFSQLLELDPEPSLPNRESQTAHAAFPSTTGHKMSRIEALKATAASLSSRIESEARKLAGVGINYGCARDTGMDLLIPNDDRWAKPVSPPVRENPTDSDDLVERIEKLLAEGQSTYDQALPGVGNLHSFRKRMETGNKQTLLPSGLTSRNTRKTPSPPKAVVQEDELDSSGGSISEGPLLSEGSISDEELQELPKSRLETTGYSAHLNGDSLNPISRFQKEAEKHLPFNVSSLVQGGSNGPWEELAKGSPHSVINIFTKNTGYSKAFEERGSKSSPALHTVLSGASSLNGMVYEEDFVSSRPSSQSVNLLCLDFCLTCKQLKILKKSSIIKNFSSGMELFYSCFCVSLGSAELQFAPGVLQQRLSAELSYLDAVEESVQQLSDVERVRGVSLAQQETVSLAQILKSQQQRHERELYLLRMKAEQEALETQRQLEETGFSFTAQINGFIEHKVSKMLISVSLFLSGGSSSGTQLSPPRSDQKERKTTGKDRSSSSVEDQAHTTADDSLCSDSVHTLLEEKDSASIATEYSVKFDDSMTEDDIEERSFRSLLPSEAHRRESLDRKPSSHPESDDDHSHDRSSPRTSSKDGNMPFSSGQDSFSKFTMDLVRQYMKEEEVRAQHQSSLLRLRQKALREKTKAELAWLEHQKRHLRDKGEDDKMPPLRKKQRGLILKLQQEQAEIKRLQEANKAARRERQLLLKQQEEIEIMRHTTLKLKERLKSADTKLESPVSGVVEESAPPSVIVTDTETRSPSPMSVSGSETSSIMQKLKKMRSHMDEKFLTKREQQLMQRRRHAEELLEWRQRLDAEEAEVRRMEKQALEAWEKQEEPHNTTPLQQRSWETGSEDDGSLALSVSSVHTDLSVPEQLASPSSDRPVSELHSLHPGNSPAPNTIHSPEFNTTDSKQVKTEPIHRETWSFNFCALTSETTSDQSDIESRIRALKDELRKRKSVVYQLKKEQKKRQKERLKAQEASLLKQLESYNDFIQKTQAELSKEPDSTPATKPQIKTPTSATEKPRIKPPPLQRPETSKDWKIITESEKSDTVPTETSADKGAVSLHSPEYLRHQSEDAPQIKEHSARPEASDLLSEDESVVSSHKSGIMEELEYAKSEGSENDQHSHPLLKLDLGLQIPSLNDMKPKFEEERLSEKDADDRPAFQDSADVGEGMRFTDLNASPVVKSKDIDYPSAEKSPSAIDRSYTPDFSLSMREDSLKMKDTPSPLGDGYKDDFESSFGSSFKEDNHESKPTSPSAPEPKEKSFKSSIYSSEEEIEEELSVRSGSTNGSFQTESHADLNSLGKGPEEDIRSPSKCSTSPQPQIPILPENDELPGFCIGDRVLVSNIQPGTLRFKGQTNFANGFWAGVELDNPEGSNNGTYDGVVYFECREKHGLFTSPDKISHLPEKLEASADTEDEDSSCDDQPNSKNKGSEKQLMHRNLLNKMKGEKSDLDLHPESREPLVEHKKPLELNIKQLSTGKSTFFKSQNNLDFNDIDCNIIKDSDKTRHTVPNGRDGHIILKFEDTSVDNIIPLLNNLDKGKSKKQKQEEEPTAVILDLLVEDEKSRVDGLQKSTDISIEEASLDNREDLNNKRALTTLADKLVENFLSDALKQFQKIKKDKEEKLSAANHLKRDFINEDDGLRSNNFKSQSRSSSKTKTDSFRTFFDDDQEELSSPEHCNRPESPVLGTSGQEELAKRLAELELSRELFDVLGDEQDWFDEDFGLSSRKQQQNEGEQVKIPPRPELPMQMKKPEEPAVIVPHTVQEVEKLVIAATQEIWKSCKLGHGRPSLIGVPKPQPSNIFLEGDSKASDLETQCQLSYKLAIFDLSWEVIQDIYTEDPKVDQPQWMKPRRLNSTYFHRVKCPNDITIVQEFVTTEVLKLCGLKKEQNQKTDWQKMIKFGRKKRDRVDHILVQELHEEESQWVNYDEDELFVKMQLADGIFDALLKDTADVLIQIQEKKSKRTL
uniref:Centrosomal protein 350 n=1 Tax=Cyprinus carpio TaxID=7962 RepID=A0A8C2ETN5_CYPCA